MKTFTIKKFEISIGSNVHENDTLFEQATDDDMWFHIYSFPSAHMWVKGLSVSTDKNTLYQIALQLKINSKFKKISSLPIVYATKNNLTRTNTPGALFISGKSALITV